MSWKAVHYSSDVGCSRTSFPEVLWQRLGPILASMKQFVSSPPPPPCGCMERCPAGSHLFSPSFAPSPSPPSSLLLPPAERVREALGPRRSLWEPCSLLVSYSRHTCYLCVSVYVCNNVCMCKCVFVCGQVKKWNLEWQ